MCFVMFDKRVTARKRFILICSFLLALFILFHHSPESITLSYRLFTCDDPPLPYCDRIDDMVDGRWVRKKDLTSEDIEERKRIDKEIRVNMGWPPTMYRNDSRCGDNYPIPGYRLQAQCDPESNKPCCNQTFGRCGNTRDYCVCESCTDSRKQMPAEIADWVPKRCRIYDYPKDEACDILNRNKVKIVFMGDSLTRQLHTMALLQLTGNYESGSLPPDIKPEDLKYCRGEHQITTKKCSMDLAVKNISRLGTPSPLCNGSVNFKIEIVADYHNTLKKEVSNVYDTLINQENTWIVGAVGFHYQLDFALAKKEYLDKVWSKLQRSKNGWPKFLWLSLHALKGFLRLTQLPHNIKVKTFNDQVERYWRDRGVQIIDTFPLSTGIKSYDGRHYGLGMNQLKMNLIFRVMDNFYRNQRQKE